MKSEKRLVDNKKSPKINVKLTIYEESSKYEGKPLITPKTPYKYDVKTFQRNPDDKTAMAKIKRRASFVAERTQRYFLDIYHMETDAVIFKTVEFIKRNWLLFRGALFSVWHAIKHTIKGFSKIKKDVLFLAGRQSKTVTQKYQRDDYFEHRKAREVKKDVVKFIPFSLFLLIPLGELFIPPYLMIFPNSMPS